MGLLRVYNLGLLEIIEREPWLLGGWIRLRNEDVGLCEVSWHIYMCCVTSLNAFLVLAPQASIIPRRDLYVHLSNTFSAKCYCIRNITGY